MNMLLFLIGHYEEAESALFHDYPAHPLRWQYV